ncbi:hypothetical protein N7537_007751 [Penicillium hordei]|uniref:Uncharacterized protein n=1 Tax=Penicillium hordei TaxID=40994 RepID=A0AAD6DZ20_9EURO|nr:uncharacterized protein N7537_007751 [Penicillium hordei]KAJ5597667.1 hypothetical protein N7537_007751 [Penicillium hordei]
MNIVPDMTSPSCSDDSAIDALSVPQAAISPDSIALLRTQTSQQQHLLHRCSPVATRGVDYCTWSQIIAEHHWFLKTYYFLLKLG